MTCAPPPNGSPEPQSAPRRRLHGQNRGRRLKASQRDLAARLLPGLDIIPDPLGNRLAPAQFFAPGTRELWLEIGFGAGEHLVWQALANPEIGVIGCEPFMNGVVKLLREIERHDLRNVRLYRDDVNVLLPGFPENCLDRVFILYPDPWPKARHHKRRIITPSFLELLSNIMRDRAELRIATDHENYLEQILSLLFRHKEFHWTARHPGDWRIRPDDWPQTRYGEKAEAGGRSSWYLRYERVPRKRSSRRSSETSGKAAHRPVARTASGTRGCRTVSTAVPITDSN